MRVTLKGQVTIPKSLRDQLGIDAGSEVTFEIVDEVIVLRKVDGPVSRGTRLVSGLRGRGDVGLTTDEIMALTRSP